jgi:dTDP-3-amino-3,4,6-trideoxy-alpha-D-glucose transaminase
VLFKNLGLSFLHIPQTNPRAGYLAQQPEIDAAVSRVLAGGGYILGREVEIFESAFADFIGVAHAVACASGTDAIELAASALAISRLLCRTLQ